MPTEKPQGLHAKLAEVMAEAGRIPKNGQYQGQGAFKYVMVGDAADAIRGALGSRGVSMLPTSVEIVSEAEHGTKSGGTMTTLTVRTTWTLVDGETAETAVIQSIGTGADSGDKASPKAQTNAMKYALLMGFLLSTGDDPEQSDSSDRQSRRGRVDERPEPNRPPLTRTTHEDGLVGKVATSGTQDFQLRETPDGWVLPFRLKDAPNRAGQIVVAHDDLARALFPFRDTLIGERVTLWGRYSDEESPKPDGFVVTYKILHLERIQTADWTLPADERAARTAAALALNADADVAMAEEGLVLSVEAESIPLFSDEEAAAILAAEKAEAAL